LQVIQSILAGQGGRLFIELRDKNSLAYSVSPMRMEGVDAGYFGAYIGCSPSKVKKALEMMKIEFQKLCDTLVPAAELERAQRYLAGRHDIDLQRVSSIGASILYDDIYGVPYDETFKLADKYFAITAEDVLRVARQIFQAPSVTSLAGPDNPFL
ncbi:MAG: M16 family metallopeptidase, partial [Pseudobdellovibrionaceae bacterium]